MDPKTKWEYISTEFTSWKSKMKSVSYLVGLELRIAAHIGLHGCNIRVHQNNFLALLLERFNSLGARVVKLASLTDTQPTTAKQEYLFNL